MVVKPGGEIGTAEIAPTELGMMLVGGLSLWENLRSRAGDGNLGVGCQAGG